MEDALKDVKALYGSYESLVKEVGAETIDNRYNKLLQTLVDFVDYKEANDKLQINKRVLGIAILDFFTDINRLKSFHHIKEINKYKEKAYEAAWILRRKPIQVLSLDEDFDYINEQFVFKYLVFFLMGERDIIDVQKINDPISNEYSDALKGYLNTLFYHLKFRDCNPQVLELVLMAFRAGEITNRITESKK